MKCKEYSLPLPIVTEHWCDGFLITFPVSYRYNGGVIIDGIWYDGVVVPSPIIPDGFVIKEIGIGLELNARPPFATVMIERAPCHEYKGKLTKCELKQALKDAWKKEIENHGRD